MRTSTDCGTDKTLDAFLPIKGYGRRRECRNKRARERYWSSPEILAAERARALRNFRERNAATRALAYLAIVEDISLSSASCPREDRPQGSVDS